MNPARGKLRPYQRRIFALIVVVVVVAAAFGAYYYATSHSQGKRTIVVYTYSSFMKYGSNATQAYNIVFGTFEREYNVNIRIVTPSGGLLSTLEAQKGSPQADIVIGLTNMDGYTAVKDGLLVKYTPPAEKYINRTLLQEMGIAAQYLTPYEYSYLGIDYNVSYFEPNRQYLTPTFEQLTEAQYASNLLLENPTTSDTGEGFLLWEISYYEYVLHQNWTDFWQSIKQYATNHIYPSWTDAFNQFETGPGKNMVVSYLTDPAYNAYFGYGNNTNSTVTYYNGTAYGWRTIYAIGIVNHSKYLSLDEAFVNYFLSPTVQNEIPTNEWMYPANVTISLPSVYSAAPSQQGIYPLNNYLNATTIAQNIEQWEVEWQLIM
jgi:thiamine transport system substrate-binding protein